MWSGPRAVGDTVTVRYKVRIKAIKDGDAKNYAYATTDPVKPGQHSTVAVRCPGMCVHEHGGH